MRTLLAQRSAILVVLTALCSLSGDGQMRAEPEWPLKLGTLENARRRHPYQPMNASAKVLTRLARQAGIELGSGQVTQGRNRDITPIREWINRQLERTDDEVQPPPAEVAAFLAEQKRAMAEIRTFLLQHRDIRYEVDIERGPAAPLPNIGGRLRLTRILIAYALQAQSRHDSAAEDYLEAAWNLQKDLWRRPELVSAVTALFGTRIVTGAARRLPSAPPWLEEIMQIDPVRLIASAVQSDTWLLKKTEEEVARSEDGGTFGAIVDDVIEPFQLMKVGNTVALVRYGTELGVSSQACAFDAARYTAGMAAATPFWNRASRNAPLNARVWVGVHRFRAERELTRKVLAWKSGAPPEPRSSCSDGKWIVSGKTIRFSKDIPPQTQNLPIRLSYAMK